MAKKKQPAPWSINTNTAADAAKSSIQETTPKKKKLKPGPKGTKEKVVIIKIIEPARKLLKQMALDDDKTMIECISDIIKKEWASRK